VRWGLAARLSAILVLGVIAFGLPVERGSGVEGDPRPNIVVIMTDDQHTGSLAKMPRVQQHLVANGTNFTSSFVSTALCCPARATFLTGQYAHNHGVWTNAPPFGGYERLDHSNTLAVWLQNAGYYTALIGKYLNGYGTKNPLEIPPGWSDWHAVVGQVSYYDYTVNENGVLQFYPDDGNGTNYLTDVLTQKAVSLIVSQKDSPRPFFLWLAYFAPHADSSEFNGPPAAPRHEGAFASEPLPQPPSFNEADVSDKPSFIRALPPLSSAQIQSITVHYRNRLESLLAVDEGVEQIVGALQDAGKLDNTIIVFTSDNGYYHGEHRLPKGKTRIYEEAIRVPLVIRGPGIRWQTIDKLVVNVDLAPTIVQYAAAAAGLRMDGLSLVPLLQNPAAPWRTSFLVEDHLKLSFAVRTETAIYAIHYTGETESYDLLGDPYELNSRPWSLDPRDQTALQRRLEQLRNCSGVTCR
jgi:arylsulfatase A-like enzyme